MTYRKEQRILDTAMLMVCAVSLATYTIHDLRTPEEPTIITLCEPVDAVQALKATDYTEPFYPVLVAPPEKPEEVK